MADVVQKDSVDHEIERLRSVKIVYLLIWFLNAVGQNPELIFLKSFFQPPVLRTEKATDFVI